MYRQATLGDVDFITGDYLAGIVKVHVSINLSLIANQHILRGQSSQ
jgi:hypothetical protein